MNDTKLAGLEEGVGKVLSDLQMFGVQGRGERKRSTTFPGTDGSLDAAHQQATQQVMALFTFALYMQAVDDAMAPWHTDSLVAWSCDGNIICLDCLGGQGALGHGDNAMVQEAIRSIVIRSGQSHPMFDHVEDRGLVCEVCEKVVTPEKQTAPCLAELEVTLALDLDADETPEYVKTTIAHSKRHDDPQQCQLCRVGIELERQAFEESQDRVQEEAYANAESVYDGMHPGEDSWGR